jgi:hypothetical protein
MEEIPSTFGRELYHSALYTTGAIETDPASVGLPSGRKRIVAILAFANRCPEHQNILGATIPVAW